MDDNLQKQMLFEQNEKSKGVAYILWLLFGWLGVHRFYAGKTKSGLAQLLLTLSVVGFVLVSLWWWLIDAFLIPDMINERNLKTIDMIYGPEREENAEETEERELPVELDEKRQRMLEDLRTTGYRKERRDEISRLYR